MSHYEWQLTLGDEILQKIADAKKSEEFNCEDFVRLAKSYKLDPKDVAEFAWQKGALTNGAVWNLLTYLQQQSTLKMIARKKAIARTRR